jgi:MFS family permease
MSEDCALSTARPTAAATLTPILVAVTIAGLGFGGGLPLLAFLLEREGVSAALNGASMAMAALASIAVTPFAPRALKRFGAAQVLIATLVMSVLSIVIMRLWVNAWFWFPMRFLFGGTLAILFVTSEFWINMAAAPHNRGRMVGLYLSLFSGGWALGALTLGVLGPYAWSTIAVVCAPLLLAIVPLARDAGRAPRAAGMPSRPALAFVLAAPAAMLAAFVFGAVEFGVFALMPIFAMRAGLGELAGSSMLTALAIGGVALGYPIGWLADRVAPQRVLVLCTLTGLVGALTLPLVTHTPLVLYPSIFLWGGALGGLYSMALVTLGARFAGGDLAAANAMIVVLYSLGGLVTPPLSGLLMDRLGPNGLALMLGALCGALAAWLLGARLSALVPARRAR